MKKIIKYLMVLFVLITMGGCKKSLEVPIQSAYTFDTYFVTDDAVNQAVVACYAPLLHVGMFPRDWYFIFDQMGWDAKPAAPLQGPYRQLSEMTFDPTHFNLSEQWNSLFRMVKRANVVLDRGSAWQPANDVEKADQAQYIGEAKFMRAFAYFYLVNNWGRVPLHTSYQETQDNKFAARAAVADIWALIEQDLKDAEVSLPLVYPPEWLGRATKGAAVALLGKSYLYEKKWADAQAELTKLTTTPFTYSLDPVYNHLFSLENQLNNPEIIFQVMHEAFQPGGRDDYYEDAQERGAFGVGTHSPRAMDVGFNDYQNLFVSDALVKSFTYPNPVTGVPGYIDPRAKYTFYGDAASGGQTEYCQDCPGGPILYPFAVKGYRYLKYEYYDKQASMQNTISPINDEIIRYADVLLMLAEAYIQQGNTGTEPLNLINQVRSRPSVNAVPYPSLGNQAAAFDILKRERRLELSIEETRYFDLIRWGIAKETINAERAAEGDVHQFQDKNVLFPIPQYEKDTNPNVASDVPDDWN